MSVYVRPAREDVREALLRTAGELFLRHGYRATSLGQIAAGAGFTKGAVYSNFGGKPELFAAAVSAQLTARTAAAVSAVASLGQSRNGLAAELTRVVLSDTWSSLLHEFRVVAAEDAGVALVYTELRHGYRQRLADQLRLLEDDLGLPADYDYDAAATLLITVISGLAAEHTAVPEAMPSARIESVLGQLIGGLLP